MAEDTGPPRRAVPELELPITLDRASAVPMTTQLVVAVREAVLSGLLEPGSRMPSSRVLATDLDVSRIVTTEAYARLVAEGYLESRRGSGTYVPHLDANLGTVPSPKQAGLRSGPAEPPAMAFRTGATSGHQHEVIAPALRAAARTPLPNRYLDAQGDPRLRAAIAAYLARSRGLATDPDHVVITTGTTQSTDLILRCLTRPGDTVALEEPSHPGLRRLMSSHRLTLNPVTVDEDGARISQLRRLPRPPRLVHVTPSHQFPLGVRMTISRRVDLIAWARTEGATILEDDYDSEYRYDGPPLPTLTALAPDSVLYLGTMSKVLSPALRCGYLVAPARLAREITRLKDLVDGPVPWPAQQLVLQLLESGNLDRHVRRTRLRYSRVRTALEEALRPVGDLVTVSGIETGLHVVLRPAGGLPAADIVDRASTAGLTVTSLADFYHEHSADDGVVLGYGALSEAEVRRDCAVLVDAVRAAAGAFTSGPTGRRT